MIEEKLYEILERYRKEEIVETPKKQTNYKYISVTGYNRKDKRQYARQLDRRKKRIVTYNLCSACKLPYIGKNRCQCKVQTSRRGA